MKEKGTESPQKKEKSLSPLVQNILSIMKNEDELSHTNGQSKKVIKILTETEKVFKTFLEDGDEKKVNEFIDSDPEIASFLTQQRQCFITRGSHRTQGSVLSYMRGELNKS